MKEMKEKKDLHVAEFQINKCEVKEVYVAPSCVCIDMEVETPILAGSADGFNDGGHYGRGGRW